MITLCKRLKHWLWLHRGCGISLLLTLYDMGDCLLTVYCTNNHTGYRNIEPILSNILLAALAMYFMFTYVWCCLVCHLRFQTTFICLLSQILLSMVRLIIRVLFIPRNLLSIMLGGFCIAGALKGSSFWVLYLYNLDIKWAALYENVQIYNIYCIWVFDIMKLKFTLDFSWGGT